MESSRRVSSIKDPKLRFSLVVVIAMIVVAFAMIGVSVRDRNNQEKTNGSVQESPNDSVQQPPPGETVPLPTTSPSLMTTEGNGPLVASRPLSPSPSDSPSESPSTSPSPSASPSESLSTSLVPSRVESPVPIFAPSENEQPFQSPMATPSIQSPAVSPSYGNGEPVAPVESPIGFPSSFLSPSESESQLPSFSSSETGSPFPSEISSESSLPSVSSSESEQPFSASASPNPGNDETEEPTLESLNETPSSIFSPSASSPESVPTFPSPAESPSSVNGETDEPTIKPTNESPIAAPASTNYEQPFLSTSGAGDDIAQASKSLSLSRDGKTVAIGQFDIAGNLQGQVGIQRYDESTGSWSLLGPSILSDTQVGMFGYSVALNGDGTVLAIGDGHDYGNTTNGRVLVYEFANDAWVQRGQTIETQDNNHFFGRSVVLSGDGLVLAIGVQLGSRNVARVYEYNGNTWEPLGQDVFGGVFDEETEFAIALSEDGYTFAMSAATPGVGYTRVYTLDVTWGVLGDGFILPKENESIGLTVSLSGDGFIAAVGIQRPGASSLVRIYELDGTQWEQLGSDIDAEGSQVLSLSLSTDGNTLAIGPQKDMPYAKIYTKGETDWVQNGGDIDASLTSVDIQLQSVSLSGAGDRVALFDPTGENVIYDYSVGNAAPPLLSRDIFPAMSPSIRLGSHYREEHSIGY